MTITSLTRRLTSAATAAIGAGAIALGAVAMSPVANADVGYLFKSCLNGGGDMKSCCLLVGGEYHANLTGDYCIYSAGVTSPDHGTAPTGPSKTPTPVTNVPPRAVQN